MEPLSFGRPTLFRRPSKYDALPPQLPHAALFHSFWIDAFHRASLARGGFGDARFAFAFRPGRTRLPRGIFTFCPVGIFLDRIDPSDRAGGLRVASLVVRAAGNPGPGSEAPRGLLGRLGFRPALF